MTFELKQEGCDPVATIYCDETTDTFTMKLTDTNSNAPAFITLLRKKGITEPEQKLVQEFVESRVISKDRQGIDEILSKEGMKEYSIHKLLEISNGRCTKDDFIIVKV